MEETSGSVQGAGLVEAAARVLRELLRTPRFKQALKIALGSLDPQSSPQLVRVLVWEDTDLFLSLLGSLPDLVNTLLLALRELVAQMENFTPELLDDFLAEAAGKIDGEALGETLGGALALASKVSGSGGRASEGLNGLRGSFSRGLARSGDEAEGEALPSPGAAALLLLGRALRGLLAAASQEGSPQRQALRELGEGLAETVRENPGAAKELFSPLAEAWRSLGEVS